MKTRPYELLVRFAPDGSIAGASVRSIITVEGKDYESDPQPLADATDPAFSQFAEAFSATTVAERDTLKSERDKLAARLAELGDKPVPASAIISPRQAKLALHRAGLLDKVEVAVESADRTVKIHYYDAIEWRRDDPVLKGLAAAIDISGSQLDELFATASRL